MFTAVRAKTKLQMLIIITSSMIKADDDYLEPNNSDESNSYEYGLFTEARVAVVHESKFAC